MKKGFKTLPRGRFVTGRINSISPSDLSTNFCDQHRSMCGKFAHVILSNPTHFCKAIHQSVDSHFSFHTLQSKYSWEFHCFIWRVPWQTETVSQINITPNPHGQSDYSSNQSFFLFGEVMSPNASFWLKYAHLSKQNSARSVQACAKQLIKQARGKCTC